MKPNEIKSSAENMEIILNSTLPVKDVTLAYLESIVKIYDAQIEGLEEERQNLLNTVYKIRESMKK